MYGPTWRSRLTTALAAVVALGLAARPATARPAPADPGAGAIGAAVKALVDKAERLVADATAAVPHG